MDTDDIVDHVAVSRVRAVTARKARRVVVVAVLAGLAGGVLVAVVVYWLYGSLAKASILLGVFFLLGLWQAIHWRLHYRSIFSQLDGLDQQVANGEIIYGSQVRFHSYR